VAGAGTLCRAAVGECDLPEVCTGSGRFCPMDVFADEGTSCLEDGNLCTTDQCSAAGNCDHLLTPNPCESVAIPADPNASADLLGGAGVVDGVSASFDSVTTSGEMAAELFLCAPSDSACLAAVALDPAPSEFQLAGDPIQSWEIEFTGSFSGNLTLIFHYDPALLDPNQNEADLQVLHFSNGVWTAVPGQGVDPIANTIQLTVQSLSPFVLGRVRDPVPFVAYKVRGTKGVTRFARLGPVTLGDALGSVDYSLLKPATLGLPAREVGDAAPLGSIHLEEYRIKMDREAPKFVRLSGVHVTNTCNDLYLELIKPASVLVPTAKSLSGPVAPPAGDTHGLDHFLCYKARQQKTLADGTPLPKFPHGLQMELEDQFQGRRYDLKKVTRLCVPAAKSGDPLFLSGPQKGTPVGLAPATVRNPAAMLLCYRVRQARKRIAQAGCGPMDPSDAGSPIVPAQEKHMKRSGIQTANQLGSEQLDTIKEFEVCLPTSATFPAP